MIKLQLLFDVIFATVVIAFVHFLVILFTPGPIPPELKAVLDWLSN